MSAGQGALLVGGADYEYQGSHTAGQQPLASERSDLVAMLVLINW